MLSFLLYYVSGNSERMIFNKNIIPNNDQAPFLIPGHEAKQNRGLPAFADNDDYLEYSCWSALAIWKRKMLFCPTGSHFGRKYRVFLMRQGTLGQRESVTGSGIHREKNCWVPGEVLWLSARFIWPRS